MRLSLVGMAGSGKSHWSRKLSEHGFRRFCCDDMIAEKLAPELRRPDGSTIKVSEWMGFPYQPHYKERESQYLVSETEVMIEILDYLGSREKGAQENVVIDTTGSVIYTGEQILRRLQQSTTVVYLAAPAEIQEQLVEAYMSNPHPMLWRGFFSKGRNETNEEALRRCYPQLFFDRKSRYEQYADVTIDYYTRRQAGFGVRDFLHALKSDQS
jgi:shikimate kinase